jgi:hypothetical protein
MISPGSQKRDLPARQQKIPPPRITFKSFINHHLIKYPLILDQITLLLLDSFMVMGDFIHAQNQADTTGKLSHLAKKSPKHSIRRHGC